ncbi:hypothetical protein ACM01_29745 [Streptomyces viridochromogenes]|uniref:DUF4865 domain-containing protein n=1 Tax=Streptomyces viridochromogenes TaxID=1938 RepID=A0A0J8BZH0_STRVR|nr:DUF4865 family protein [Streptomyces viridochromogenes]KMS70860.1 hypothetical protein ACM01_29745 [Streptomyces viridochromogenes]
MHAMQYELTLPADYDMEIIRRRVASRGHLLDDWQGLGLKAYLVRERGLHGSPVNQYAPFYLWNTGAGMNAFLWGGPFQGIVDDFGRPSVRQWSGLAYEEGGAADSPGRVAVVRRQQVPDGGLLADVRADAARETERLAGEGGVVLAASAVETSRWELIHFSLWGNDTPEADGDLYEVLHMSAPGRDRVPG